MGRSNGYPHLANGILVTRLLECPRKLCNQAWVKVIFTAQMLPVFSPVIQYRSCTSATVISPYGWQVTVFVEFSSRLQRLQAVILKQQCSLTESSPI